VKIWQSLHGKFQMCVTPAASEMLQKHNTALPRANIPTISAA
jgi:hypothetical protein